MPSKITITVPITITVDLEKWADTYGQDADAAEDDARSYVPTLARNAVAEQLAVGDFSHTLTLED